MEDGPWYLPGSAVNEMRRAALESLLQKREAPCPWPVQPVQLPQPVRRTLPPGPHPAGTV